MKIEMDRRLTLLVKNQHTGNMSSMNPATHKPKKQSPSPSTGNLLNLQKAHDTVKISTNIR